MHTRVPLILASASPRRKQLLDSIGLPCSVEVSGVDESGPTNGESTAELVERLSIEKAQAVANRHDDALVLGADTVVSLNNDLLGKPANASEARSMLKNLSNRTNTVYSGIALVHRASGRCYAAHERTDVKFSELSDDEIERYVSSGAPMDKAGAYGIQGDMGALFISGIQGDYFNVVGLPLHRMYRLLRDQFPDLIRM